MTKILANQNIRAFTTNVNKPSVRILTGKVRIITRGLIRALITPKITAKINAVQKLETSIPGIKRATPKMTSALIKSRRMNLIVLNAILQLKMDFFHLNFFNALRASLLALKATSFGKLSISNHLKLLTSLAGFNFPLFISAK